MGIAYTNSQLLNNIIRLADNPYRYNHISFNAEGDMVLDIESYPVTKIRKFYGIKKNGRAFFYKDNRNNNSNSYQCFCGYITISKLSCLTKNVFNGFNIYSL